MIKHHGLKNGLKRFYEEIFENRMFDWKNGVETSGIVHGPEYDVLVGSRKDVTSYWPTYTTPLLKSCRKLREFCTHGKTLFIDLGTGKGKPMIVAWQILGCKVIGVELSGEILEVCRKNLDHCKADYELICGDVLNVDYKKMFQGYDTVIVHNKNSFDRTITAKTLELIQQAKTGSLFYIYNNPLYKELFAGKEVILTVDGWHKNWRTNLYRL